MKRVTQPVSKINFATTRKLCTADNLKVSTDKITL